jgi:hypothetical protein
MTNAISIHHLPLLTAFTIQETSEESVFCKWPVNSNKSCRKNGRMEVDLDMMLENNDFKTALKLLRPSRVLNAKIAALSLVPCKGSMPQPQQLSGTSHHGWHTTTSRNAERAGLAAVPKGSETSHGCLGGVFGDEGSAGGGSRSASLRASSQCSHSSKRRSCSVYS